MAPPESSALEAAAVEPDALPYGLKEQRSGRLMAYRSSFGSQEDVTARAVDVFGIGKRIGVVAGPLSRSLKPMNRAGAHACQSNVLHEAVLREIWLFSSNLLQDCFSFWRHVDPTLE